MRWVFLAILTYILVLLQTTVVGLVTFRIPWVGYVGPDLLAVLAVFVALRARSGVDVMLTAWILGMTLDVTTGAGARVSTAVGPMAIGYVLAAGVAFRIREIFFRDSVPAQCLLAFLFCLTAHGVWVISQWLLALRSVSAGGLMAMLVQVLLVSIYTAAIMPLVCIGLRRCERWIIAPSPSGRRRRR